MGVDCCVRLGLGSWEKARCWLNGHGQCRFGNIAADAKLLLPLHLSWSRKGVLGGDGREWRFRSGTQPDRRFRRYTFSGHPIPGQLQRNVQLPRPEQHSPVPTIYGNPSSTSATLDNKPPCMKTGSCIHQGNQVLLPTAFSHGWIGSIL